MMRIKLLALLLALAQATHANVARVKVTAPSLASPAAGLASAPALLSLAPVSLAPAASAPSPLSPAPALDAPAVLPSAPAGPLPAAPETGPAASLIASLREHGALAGDVAAAGDASAAESNFLAAAGLAAPTDAPRSGLGRLVRALKGSLGAAAAPAHDELYRRLLERVTIDDRGKPEERAALEKTVRRMLDSPTARAYAEQFIAEGMSAVVRFAEVEGSRIYDNEGRKIFYAPRAFTYWIDGRTEVRLNRDYLDGDARFFAEDAPATLAHELLGHGLWHERMSRDGLLGPFFIHEDNETNAKLLGWVTAWELDGRFQDDYAWEYLADPAAYLKKLKLRHTYYAVTLSDEQLADPVQALAARREDARELRRRHEAELAGLRQPANDGRSAAGDHALREALRQREEQLAYEVRKLTQIEELLNKAIDFYRAAARPAPPADSGAPQLERLTRLATQIKLELDLNRSQQATSQRRLDRLTARRARVERLASILDAQDGRAARALAKIAERAARLAATLTGLAKVEDAVLAIADFHHLLEGQGLPPRAAAFARKWGLLTVLDRLAPALRAAADRQRRSRAHLASRLAAARRAASRVKASPGRVARVEERIAAREKLAAERLAYYTVLEEARLATAAFHELKLMREAIGLPQFARLRAEIEDLTRRLREAVSR